MIKKALNGVVERYKAIITLSLALAVLELYFTKYIGVFPLLLAWILASFWFYFDFAQNVVRERLRVSLFELSEIKMGLVLFVVYYLVFFGGSFAFAVLVTLAFFSDYPTLDGGLLNPVVALFFTMPLWIIILAASLALFGTKLPAACIKEYHTWLEATRYGAENFLRGFGTILATFIGTGILFVASTFTMFEILPNTAFSDFLVSEITSFFGLVAICLAASILCQRYKDIIGVTKVSPEVPKG